MNVVFRIKSFSNQTLGQLRQDLFRILICTLLLTWLLSFLWFSHRVFGDLLYSLCLPLFVLTLLIAAIFVRHNRRRLLLLTLTGAIGGVLLSVGMLITDGLWHAVMLALLGIAAAPLALRLGVLMKEAVDPVSSALIGLILAVLLMLALPIDGEHPIRDQILLGGGLLTPGCLLLFGLRRMAPRRATFSPAQGDPVCLTLYLPFVLAFQFFIGFLLVARLTPEAIHLSPGRNAAAFLLGVLLANWLRRHHRRSVIPVASVVLATCGVLLLDLLSAPGGLFLCFLACMTALGIVACSLLVWMLEHCDAMRAFGYGLGVFFGGILLGHWFAATIDGIEIWILLIGLLLLNLGQVVSRRALPVLAVETADGLEVAIKADAVSDDGTPLALLDEAASPAAALPASLLGQLSRQERDVLEHLRDDLTYREIAGRLGISESSVKTYVQRIFRKLGVCRRTQLLRVIERELASQSE